MNRRAIQLAWLSLAGMTAVWLVIGFLGDRVWLALPFLYGPRWIWWGVFAGTVPALLSAPRRAWFPAVASLLLLLFGILDLHLGLGRLTAPSGATVRIMELNADGGNGNLPAVLDAIHEYAPEVVVLAECGDVLRDSIAKTAGYHFHRALSSLCLLSRGEILEWVERDPQKDIWVEGGAGAIVRATVMTSAGAIRVGLVHLETPRNALQMYMDKSEILKQGPSTRQNMNQRERESGLAQQWIDQGPALPLVIAGDFNLPVESAIYRRHWSGYRNAFSTVGFGFGNTKHTRRWGIRIDHILSSEDVVPVRTFVGKNVGSDHLPVIADLLIRSTQRTSTAR